MFHYWARKLTEELAHRLLFEIKNEDTSPIYLLNHRDQRISKEIDHRDNVTNAVIKVSSLEFTIKEIKALPLCS